MPNTLVAPAVLPAAPVPLTLDEVMAPLFETAKVSSSLIPHAQPAQVGWRRWSIPKFLLLGQRGGGRPIRVALLAGLDAGSIETSMALARLLLQYELAPRLARDYALFAYPVVNMAAFDETPRPLAQFEHRYAGKSADEDVRYFQSELSNWSFDGLISLRTDEQAEGFHAAVRSKVIGEEVVHPALRTIARVLPLRDAPVTLRPGDRAARFADFVQGKLIPPPAQRPHPFDIEVFAPTSLPLEQRVTGLFLVVQEILRNYRQTISHAADL